MLSYAALPHLNALLNGASAVVALLGLYAIRRSRRRFHRRCMTAAFAFSTLFIISYLVYHAEAGSTPMTRQGWIRPVYFTILVSHSILAVISLPLVVVTLGFALKEDYVRHRRMARWAFPVWTYVSATGVLIYLMLYR